MNFKEWMHGWIPTPVKFWTAIIIVLCISAIYGHVQEYNDMQGLQSSLNDVSDQIDNIPTPAPVVVTNHFHHYHTPIIIHHHIHKTFDNPIVDIFNKIFHRH